MFNHSLKKSQYIFSKTSKYENYCACKLPMNERNMFVIILVYKNIFKWNEILKIMITLLKMTT